jgi:hypothetical protein
LSQVNYSAASLAAVVSASADKLKNLTSREQDAFGIAGKMPAVQKKKYAEQRQ